MQRAATLFALGCIAALLAATAASAGRPSFNPVCNGTKIDSPVSGTYDVSFGDATGTITLAFGETDAGQVFTFETDSDSHIVRSMLVKGGNVDPASYSPGTWAPVDAFHAPLNKHSGYWYDVSWICFDTQSSGGVG